LAQSGKLARCQERCLPFLAVAAQAGEIESESAAILEAEGIRCGDFPPEVEACLPPTPWVGIQEQDLEHRRDFR